MHHHSSKTAVIEQTLNRYRLRGDRLVASSSFQTHSIPMLHLLQTLQPSIPVAFLDTGYHFPETIEFRDQITEMLDLNLVILRSKEPDSAAGLFVSSETECCQVHKVDPMNELLGAFDVWITGVRSDQTSTRSNFRTQMPGPFATERYHPMLTWSASEIEDYRSTYQLPAHPLDAAGYTSIGCAPCTSVAVGNGRSGRWLNTEKTECGLHTVGNAV